MRVVQLYSSWLWSADGYEAGAVLVCVRYVCESREASSMQQASTVMGSGRLGTYWADWVVYTTVEEVVHGTCKVSGMAGSGRMCERRKAHEYGE